ncbi:hypothetical protein Q7P37_002015 [Cladosporium fusiforme]
MVSQIILFSQPRSGSHLLERMLTKQTNLDVLAHPFSASRGKQVPWLLRDGYEDGMEAEERREYEEGIAREVKGWEGRLEEAEKTNRTLFVHSHPFFPVSPEKMLEYMHLVSSASTSAQTLAENFMLLPDSLLLRPGTIPLITIREPRLTVPSTYRVLDRMDLPHAGSRAMFLVATCNVWNCVLYNFYKAHGVEPVVLDADDYMTSRDFVRVVCSKIGLDPSQVLFEWDVAAVKEDSTREWNGEVIHPMQYASQDTLYRSSGVDAGLAARNVDLEEGRGKWEDEFGEDVGLVREMVRLAEPHYRFLNERRFVVGA